MDTKKLRRCVEFKCQYYSERRDRKFETYDGFCYVPGVQGFTGRFCRVAEKIAVLTEILKTIPEDDTSK